MEWKTLSPQPLSADWATTEAEWRHYLTVVLSERLGVTGLGMALVAEPFTHYEVNVTVGPELPTLHLYNEGEGVVAGVDAEDPEGVAAWQEVIDEITRRLGSEGREFPWVAYIGADHVALESTFSLGGLELEGGDSPYFESDTSGRPQYGALNPTWSYPVRVSGVAEGLEWQFADAHAGEDLYRLIALTSLATDRLWRVQHSPQYSELDKIETPKHPPGGEMLATAAEPGEGTRLDKQSVELPPWLTAAWERAHRRDLAGPLAAFYRAMTIEGNDPASAITLYVAAVEGIGAFLEDLVTCEHCNVSRGARKRFRAALDVVMSEADGKALLQTYDLRSGSAHGSLIDGQPLTVGSYVGLGGMFYTTKGHELFGKIVNMRIASREVLIAALSGDEPFQGI